MNVTRCSRCKERFFIRPHSPRGLRCPVCSARLDGGLPARGDAEPALPIALVPPPAAEPGSYDRRDATYRSIRAFVAERRERLYSRECDFGLRWRDGSTLYRAAWIAETGEFYLVQLGAPEAGGGHVELLARGIEADELKDALAGWSKAQDAGDHSLDWLRERVRELTREHAAA